MSSTADSQDEVVDADLLPGPANATANLAASSTSSDHSHVSTSDMDVADTEEDPQDDDDDDIQDSEIPTLIEPNGEFLVYVLLARFLVEEEKASREKEVTVRRGASAGTSSFAHLKTLASRLTHQAVVRAFFLGIR